MGQFHWLFSDKPLRELSLGKEVVQDPLRRLCLGLEHGLRRPLEFICKVRLLFTGQVIHAAFSVVSLDTSQGVALLHKMVRLTNVEDDRGKGNS